MQTWKQDKMICSANGLDSVTIYSSFIVVIACLSNNQAHDVVQESFYEYCLASINSKSAHQDSIGESNLMEGGHFPLRSERIRFKSHYPFDLTTFNLFFCFFFVFQGSPFLLSYCCVLILNSSFIPPINVLQPPPDTPIMHYVSL